VHLESWLAASRSAFDAFMADRFQDAWPASFAAPMRYPVFGGGKRVRPALALAAYQALAPEPSALLPVLHGAAAVELVHTYSLVHDDLPCLDDDVERRGRPTVHVKWDVPTALLVGDALLTEAFTVLAEAPMPAERVVRSIRLLSRAAGYRGMVGGQAADVGLGGPVEDEATLLRLHRLKTGALIAAATVLGGIAAGADAPTLARLEAYGQAVGLAFQLADDRLDADEDAGEGGPPSFVKLLGLDQTRARARALADEAVDAVRGLGREEALVALARYTVDREV
jgi:geranylgeranyl pyrophosphate synthase